MDECVTCFYSKKRRLEHLLQRRKKVQAAKFMTKNLRYHMPVSLQYYCKQTNLHHTSLALPALRKSVFPMMLHCSVLVCCLQYTRPMQVEK